MDADNHPHELWKNHNTALPPQPSATGICALARRRERENIWQRRLALLALAGLAVAFAHNTWEVDQPSVRAGQGWMLIVMTLYLGSVIRNRTNRKAPDETCAAFLLRSLKTKRDGFLAVRRVVLLTIPAMLASWWGGGPALKARAMGLDPASLWYRYLTSVWPMVATCCLLLFVWLAFTGAARKSAAELEELRERIFAS